MATSNNKFLASDLSSASVKGRTAATFADNRVKTATPLPYTETITPGKNGVSGSIFYTDDNGNQVPEVSAYIYIYINGFLLNPPSLNPDGSFNNDKTSILSRKDGSWTTGEFFFSVLPEFQFGQTITFRAKAPLKQISDRSVPYMIGGMPAPIELGVYGDNGILRAPYEGESSIIGRVSYWMGHLPPYVTDPTITGNVTSLPIYDCNNHIYVYVDGMHAGTANGVLGEIFRNEIRGTDAKYPFSSSLAHQTLSLMVDKKQVDIPLVDIQPIDTALILGERSKAGDPNANQTFTFLQPQPNLGIKLFKNGMRLMEGWDYNYRIDVDAGTNLGTIQFNSTYVTPTQSDRMEVMFQYQAGSFVIAEKPSGVIDGTNDTFTLGQTPRVETFELYRNGLHLTYLDDYTISGKTITMLTDQIPETGDTLLADYQPSTAKSRFVYVEKPSQLPDGVISEFGFTIPNILGNPHVYRNGLLQRRGEFFDYTIVRETVIKFNPWAIPQVDDELLVAFYATPVLLSQIVDYLNQTKQFKENCLTASTLNTKVIENYVLINGKTPEDTNGSNKYYSLPTAALPTNLRLFMNGLRQKESINGSEGDYFIDYEKALIAFINPPEKGSIIAGLFNYMTTDFVVGEIPTGNIGGNNVIFHLALVPKPSTVQIYWNGIRLNPYAYPLPDYVVAQNQITFQGFAPVEGDTILVDYEIAFGFETFTSTIIPQGQITGYNGKFTFPTPEVGTAVNVFKNGLLQKPSLDYLRDRNTITFSGSAGVLQESQVPQRGDSVLVDFMEAALFTNNPNDQLRIISPYTLDIKRYKSTESPIGFAGKTLFGSAVELYPGKDDDGEFRFWFNRQTGYWKWTWYDPVSGITTPFVTGMRITARAKNDTPFIYKKKR